ncbi:MAG: apolipoprotein N-acyltransferase [Gammaproteobacteria bacterium]|nr:MAG: apolipoprotein N-acyltransferase [Gammaproteobacteria bacterium]
MRKDFIALFAGALLPLAFSPYDFIPLAFISLALLFYCWLDTTASGKRLFLRGFLFGVGLFGFGISWIFVSIHQYGGASILVASIMTAALASGLALFPALVGLMISYFSSTSVLFRLTAVFPLIWMLVEWLRSWFLTGFTWLQVGNSQLDSPLVSLAPIFGVLGVGYAVSLASGLIVGLFYSRGKKRGLLVATLVGLLAVSFLLKPVSWTAPEGEPFSVTLIQGNIPQELKWERSVRQKTLQLYRRLTEEHWDSRLIIWPETAIPAFYHQVKNGFLAELSEEARRHNSDLLIGVPVADQSSGQYYNAVASIGEKEGLYLKRHLVPFGEYLPLKPLSTFIADQLQIPMSDFGAGSDDQLLLEAAGYPLAISICYEDIFGEESRVGLPEARYLVNVTNDGWFGDTAAPHQHLQMARMRAVEVGRYMLRATNTGATAIIRPDGSIQSQAPFFKQTTLSGDITAMKGVTPYVMWGDSFMVAFMFLQLIVVVFTGYVARQKMDRRLEKSR